MAIWSPISINSGLDKTASSLILISLPIFSSSLWFLLGPVFSLFLLLLTLTLEYQLLLFILFVIALDILDDVLNWRFLLERLVTKMACRHVGHVRLAEFNSGDFFIWFLFSSFWRGVHKSLLDGFWVILLLLIHDWKLIGHGHAIQTIYVKFQTFHRVLKR